MAIAPAPESKAINIIEALNEMAKTGTVDKFALARYKREAEQIKKIGLFKDAFIILGMIACLEGDFEKMHDSHINAIHYAPNDPASYSNYGISLIKAGMLEEAYEYFVKTYKIEPNNIDFLNDVIEVLFDLTTHDNKYESDLEYYAEYWKNLTGEHHPLYDDPGTTAKMIDECEEKIERNPEVVTELDLSTWQLVESLVKDVKRG